jgi:hypothetical protein
MSTKAKRGFGAMDPELHSPSRPRWNADRIECQDMVDRWTWRACPGDGRGMERGLGGTTPAAVGPVLAAGRFPRNFDRPMPVVRTHRPAAALRSANAGLCPTEPLRLVHVSRATSRYSYGRVHVSRAPSRCPYGRVHVSRTTSRCSYGRVHVSRATSRYSYGRVHVSRAPSPCSYGRVHVSRAPTRYSCGRARISPAPTRYSCGRARISPAPPRYSYGRVHVSRAP